MPENIINKVVYGNRTLIDLTSDTITQADVINGKSFHAADGTIKAGTCTYDVDSSGVTAQQSEVLAGKTFAKSGSVLTGNMVNVGRQTTKITTKAQSVAIAQGYHDGSGTVDIDGTEQAKIVAGNIKNGVQILGVTGSYTGSELIKATTGTATPYTTAQTILPSDVGDFDYFTQFTVAAITYTETENSAGGYTATIGAVAPA